MLPAAPDSLVATPGGGQITLTWLDPDDGTIEKYQWRVRSYFRPQFVGWSDLDGSDRTTVTHTWESIPIWSWFTFEVRASNGAGLGDSTRVSVLSGPPPSGFTATPGDGSVTLAWDNLTGSSRFLYEIRHGEGEAPTGWTTIDVAPESALSTPSHTVTGLTNGTEYRFEVRAKAGAVYGDPSRVTVMLPA